MLNLWAAGRLAAQSQAPLLPDLNARLHASDSTPWTILFVLTLITVLPAIVMSMTPLVRLLVVFHFLRQALGTQTAPSNPTLMGLALMMTWFLMTPVLTEVDQQAVEPYRSGQLSGWEAIDRGSRPVKHFLLHYAREKDLALFVAAGQVPRPNVAEDLPMRVVIPAYILSELKAGFAIGAVLFLPFLLIDMVTAAILASPLLGEGTDQKSAWAELLREVAESACGDLLVRAGKQCRVAHFEPVEKEGGAVRAFQLSALDHVWRVGIHDQVGAPHDESILRPHPETSGPAHPPPASSSLPAGVELLLDVELAASLRFGSREMPLAEVLDLGPGDVVQLDRHVADPVDLIVGDKIVARGEVVLVNGNFGLRVTEVAEPRSRLESIRCLF